jgi:hypothetical protein
MPQPFLHDGQHIFIPAAFGVQHPLWEKPCLCHRGSEKIAPCQRLEHRTFIPRLSRCNACSEEGSSGIVIKTGACTRHFVQCGDRQTPRGELPVDGLYTKGERCRSASLTDPLHSRDTGAQGLQAQG